MNSVSREFNGHKALDHVSFTVNDGGAVAILGPSGSGKTTLLRIIAGLEVPDGGEVWFDDRRVSGPGWAEPPYSRSIGFVFQTPALWPHMTLAENVLFGMGQIPTRERKIIAYNLFSRAGIPHLIDRYPDEVSGGEARRVSIIRAMASQQRIILMDEPLTNLDQKLKEDFITIIREIVVENSRVLIYVTHNEDEADQIGLIKIRLDQGRLCDDSTD